MFLRRYERRSGGRRRTYWALVESVRTGRGSRQRVVAYLGELKRSERSGWAQLGRKLSGKRRLEEALRKMQSAAECGRLKDEAVANRRLGRLPGQYWRAAGAFDVKIERLSPP